MEAAAINYIRQSYMYLVWSTCFRSYEPHVHVSDTGVHDWYIWSRWDEVCLFSKHVILLPFAGCDAARANLTLLVNESTQPVSMSLAIICLHVICWLCGLRELNLIQVPYLQRQYILSPYMVRLFTERLIQPLGWMDACGPRTASV